MKRCRIVAGEVEQPGSKYSVEPTDFVYTQRGKFIQMIYKRT